jgi:hypothetical protein
MKTLEITLYSFNELTEQAKEKALTNYQCETGYLWEHEAFDSLEAFFNAIGVKLTDYSIDWSNPNQSFIKYEGTPNGQFIKHDLTGVCFDYPLSTTWNKTKDIDQSVWALLCECKSDYEYFLSEQAYTEHCEANEIYFDEQGNIFNQ